MAQIIFFTRPQLNRLGRGTLGTLGQRSAWSRQLYLRWAERQLLMGVRL